MCLKQKNKNQKKESKHLSSIWRMNQRIFTMICLEIILIL